MPKEAIMKENSPICARLKPHKIEVCRFCPESSTPPAEKISLPAMVTIISTIMGSQYSTSSAGSTSMPTETKNTAPKISFTGVKRCSIFSEFGASAISEPIIKAPSAAEKPRCVARTTMPRQRPMEVTSIVSLFISFSERL